MLSMLILCATTFGEVPSGDKGAAIANNGRLNSELSSIRGLIIDQVTHDRVAGALNADAADEIEQIAQTATMLRVNQNANFFRNAGYPEDLLKQSIPRFKADAAKKKSDGTPEFPEYEGLEMVADSAVQGGVLLARNVEALWGKALEQASPELQGLKLFPVISRWGGQDGGGGYESVVIDRFLERGQAKVWGGGSQGIPKSALKQVSMTVPFRYLVSSAEWSFFAQLSFDRAKIDGVGRMIATAVKAVEQLHDQIIWYGSSGHGLYGVLTYPWLSTRWVPTVFSASADKEAMNREITSLFTIVSETSNGAYMPTDLAIASKLYNFLATTPYSTVSGRTILQTIQSGLDTVVSGIFPGRTVTIKSVAKLNDAGGAGTHGVFAFQNTSNAIAVLTSNPTSMLPMRQIDAQLSQVVWKAIAGVVMPDVGANYLGYVVLR